VADFSYWRHTIQVLQDFLPNHVIHPVRTRPTASLPWRTERLERCIRETAGPHDPIHLVGHSTGAIDARLLAHTSELSPRVRSIVSVCGPHHGTPTASFFSSVFGRQLLAAFSICTVYILRYGQLPVGVALKLSALMARAGERVLGSDAGELMDELNASLLGDFGEQQRQAVTVLLREVSEDTSLLPQLTPDAMSVFNATTPDREGMRIGSIACRAEPPRLKSALAAGLRPRSHAMNLIFRFIWNVTSKTDNPDNDGIVPTASQRWGTLLREVKADHLDIIGHYGDTALNPPRYDWLPTNSGFNRHHFRAVWGDVAAFIEG
jgi:triacylglycerol lipase